MSSPLPARRRGIDFWNDESQDYSERVDILVKNGVLGLILVFIALALFLEIRLALWVAVGLATAAIGALTVMQVFDIALHTVSVFAFVMAIGIIVDDAIVVAEHIYLERQQGTPGVVAAIRGVRRIKRPLTFAVLISVAAFLAAAVHSRRDRRSLGLPAGHRYRHAADLARGSGAVAPKPGDPCRDRRSGRSRPISSFSGSLNRSPM